MGQPIPHYDNQDRKPNQDPLHRVARVPPRRTTSYPAVREGVIAYTGPAFGRAVYSTANTTPTASTPTAERPARTDRTPTTAAAERPARVTDPRTTLASLLRSSESMHVRPPAAPSAPQVSCN